MITIGVPYWAIGVLICVRRPWNRIGWLLLVSGLPNGLYVVVVYTLYGRQHLAGLSIAWMMGWLFWVSAYVTLIFLLLLYPTGGLVSRRWRPVAWAAAAWGPLGWRPWS
jgi:hypothetical protein